MSKIFFVSSDGDTDLANEAIKRLLKQSSETIYLVPLTERAVKKIQIFKNENRVNTVSLSEMTEEKLIFPEKISSEVAQKINAYLVERQITQAFVGVPSNNNETPYQIARVLSMPCAIAYEYMFKTEHRFWEYLNDLSKCRFEVSLLTAAAEIKKSNPNAQVDVIGHLSLEPTVALDATATRKNLDVKSGELVFVSGSSQPGGDYDLVRGLLAELATGKYPTLQLRMGVHPNVAQPDRYLQKLFEICQEYPSLHNQFKIIINDELKNKLQGPLFPSPFLILTDVSGPEAAQAADKITQAVPGRLANEAAMAGKPVYFPPNEKVTPYLPEWFCKNVSGFFQAQRQAPHSKQELGLTNETAADNLVKTFSVK